ncbi:MAG TPA: prepilin-type N-terminal cleavage/methylation domain-containing protein, partial [Tichowtungia sp.]|nr:prepilin-type N-terminal cleavage/methylation domain-containing protein [Tichowtungia sp.]
MKERALKSGMTLVEVMISVVLVAVAAIIVYTEMIVSYRILMRSRARLEAQSMAFDELWENYSMSLPELETYSTSVVQVAS